MTLADLIPLLPLLLVAAAIVATLLAAAFYRRHAVILAITLIGLVLSLAAVPFAARAQGRVTPLFLVDGYALFYAALLLATALVVALFSYGYLEQREINREEYYTVLLLATLGSVALVMSNHFASFFLGLETLSVSLYVLIAYLCQEERSIEAGVKYLVLAAASAAFLLFGMALVYAESGQMALDSLVSSSGVGGGVLTTPFLAGLSMILVGVGFKLAVVPFHFWTPDIYEGAPAPVAAFVATASKGAMVALLLRFSLQVGLSVHRPLFAGIATIALASMFIGNLFALLQRNLKRLLAGSSIAHMGYVLIATLVGGTHAVLTTNVYLLAYFAAMLMAFGGLIVLSGREHDADRLEDYRGLFWQRPWLAAVFVVSLTSLAGIPLTAGFIAKFYILSIGAEASLWLLVIALALTSVIGLYYYLRTITFMFLPSPPEESDHHTAPFPSVVTGSVLAVLTAVVLGFGVYPTPVIRAIEIIVADLNQGLL